MHYKVLQNSFHCVIFQWVIYYSLKNKANISYDKRPFLSIFTFCIKEYVSEGKIPSHHFSSWKTIFCKDISWVEKKFSRCIKGLIANNKVSELCCIKWIKLWSADILNSVMKKKRSNTSSTKNCYKQGLIVTGEHGHAYTSYRRCKLLLCILWKI